MAKYLVESYYTCSFKVKHYIDNLSEKEEKEIISDHQKLKKIEVEIAIEHGNVTTK